MNRMSVCLLVGILLEPSLLVEARAQSRAAAGVRSSRRPSSTAKRPSGSYIRSNFLNRYLPPVAGLQGFGNSGGGSARSKSTPSPLGASHQDPSIYQKKRRVPAAHVPKAKSSRKPKVMVAAPARPGHSRNDRKFSNGLTPQSSLYLGTEGSSVQQEPDRRAAMAKSAAPVKSKKTHIPGRSFSTSSNPPDRGRPAAKK
jgi:hypothetical protein